MTTVVIIDDHPAIVAGIATWCATADPRITVLGSGATPAAAWTAPGLGADVVVFEVRLTGETPAYAELRRLVDAGRRVVVYTMREDRKSALRCLGIGALAYLTKTDGIHLVPAIHAAGRCQPYTAPAMARAISAGSRPERPRLTPREIDVLINWFVYESKEMAAHKLGLSVHTVDTYIDRARIRYAHAGRPASTKALLVVRAIQDGLIGLDDL